jgi:D-arabinose 1-dehydrogenase-like Zn-dependent alcohol dehydrogenase
MCDSCRTCERCKQGLEQYCTGKRVLTYNSIGYDGELTYGGYSEKIVTDERYAIRIPKSIPLENAAPMFCAGITVYSPLRHWKAGPGRRVAILGFGGLGHLGVQIASAMGAHVTVLDLSLAKQDDGLRLGADDYRCTTDPAVFKDLASSFDLIVSTVPVNVDMDAYIHGSGRGAGTEISVVMVGLHGCRPLASHRQIANRPAAAAYPKRAHSRRFPPFAEPPRNRCRRPEREPQPRTRVSRACISSPSGRASVSRIVKWSAPSIGSRYPGSPRSTHARA